MRTIAICNQKGGVGKSTTCTVLGAGLLRKGYKVLFVDLDAQGNLSYSMGITNSPRSSMELLTGTVTAKEAIIGTVQGHLIPASPALGSADVMLKDIGKEYLLKEALEPVKKNYDYILIDCAPSLGILAVNALTACDEVLIPALADAWSLQGIGLLSQTLKAVKKYCNKSLKVNGILITRYKTRAILPQQMAKLLNDTATDLGTQAYNTRIRECIAISEAQCLQQDLFSYAPKSNAVTDYNAFIEEFLEREKA